MMVATELTTKATYFTIGSIVEYSWFRGKVVGINFPSLSMMVRVSEVIYPSSHRCIGDIHRVPFNFGKEINHALD